MLPFAALPATLDPDPQSLPGALRPSLSCGPLVPFLFLVRVVFAF